MTGSGGGRGRWTATAVLVAVTIAGIAALWLRFNVPPGRVGKPFPHDLVYYFLPQLDQVGQRLSSGELPLWNPDPCTGLPLLASMQVAVFHPTTWLAAALPAADALSAIVLVHLLLGGVGFGLLLRSWQLPASLAGAFGVVFVFACLLGQSFWPAMVVTLSWVPILLLCSERVMAAERLDGWWLGLCLATGLQLLSGFPQFAAYGLQVLAPLAVLRGWQRGRAEGSRAAVRAVARVVAGLLLGAGIAMVQLGPSLEVLGASERSEPFTELEVHYLQANERLPRILANSVDPAPRLTTYELGRDAGYLGIGTLVLAAFALAARRRDPLVWYLAGAGLVWLVLADGYLGRGAHLYRLYAQLPAIGLFRAPERLLAAAFLCVIALASLGARAADPENRAAGRERWVAGGAALAAACVIAIAGPWAAGWRAAVALGWITAGLTLPRPIAVQHAWRGAGALLIVADVAMATGAFGSLRDVPERLATRMRAGPHEMVSTERLHELRDRAGHSRIEFIARGTKVRPLMGIGDAANVHRLACYETLLPGQWPELSKRAKSPDFRSAVMSNVEPARVPKVYDAASVAYWVRATSLGKKAPLRVEATANPDALPRAYLVDRYEVVANDAALDRLVAGTVDVQTSVLLDEEPGFVPGNAIPAAVPAEIVRLEPERVEVATRSPGPALLVLTDTDAPGWRATVDGAPAPIHRANGLFRAVHVPEGEHRVVFEYAPSGLRWGALVSLMSLAATLLAWRVARRARANP